MIFTLFLKRVYNSNMVGLQPSSWYPTHVTKKVVWLFFCSLLFFFLSPPPPFCRGKCKGRAWVNMTCKWWKQNVCSCQNKRACKMQMCGNAVIYANAMHGYDEWQMREWYVHCNAMKRCLCGVRHKCILQTWEPGRLSILTCNIWQHSAPCMHLRRRHGPFDFPWRNDGTKIQRMRDNAMRT